MPQPHISRMVDAVITCCRRSQTCCMAGLVGTRSNGFAALRKVRERTWERRALGRSSPWWISPLFQDVGQFDTQPDNFSPQRVV